MLKKFLLVLVAASAFSVCPNEASAEVFWEFQFGGMAKQKTAKDDFRVKSCDRWQAFGGFGLFIPLSSRTPLMLETALRYRNAPLVYSGGLIYHTSISRVNMLEIPLKLDYEWRWNEQNALRFGAGIYGSYLFADLDGNRKFLVGIEPSVTYCHRSFSVGVSYTNPLIIKEPNYSLASNLNLTFGIRFNSGGWANIGRGLAVVGTAGLAVANAYYGNYGNVSDNTGGTAYSQYESTGNGGGDQTKAQNALAMYQKWEKRAKEAYESMAGHSGSASTYIRNQKLLKDAQREMQKYRQQAARNGLTIPISEWETKKIKLD